ncbi:MAG TPA: hypothetical protein VF528_19305 [Pyrinomonadaceae bacterium]|jgi:hypothetical protein
MTDTRGSQNTDCYLSDFRAIEPKRLTGALRVEHNGYRTVGKVTPEAQKRQAFVPAFIYGFSLQFSFPTNWLLAKGFL